MLTGMDSDSTDGNALVDQGRGLLQDRYDVQQSGLTSTFLG